MARKLAAEERQPLTWFLIGLVHERAKKSNIEPLPPLPWEVDDEPKAGK